METMQALFSVVIFVVILGGTLPLSLLMLGDRHFRQTRSPAYRLLTLLTIWSTFQIVLGLLLGVVGQLSLVALVLVELLFAGVGIYFITIRSKLTPESLLQERLNDPLKFSSGELVILSSIAFIGLFLLVILTTHPIVDYDSLWFHLPAIARWYQSNSLTLLDPTGRWIFEHPDATGYPYNWHILLLFCLLPFGNDGFVALPMLLCWVMMGLAVYLLSLEFGASRFYSLAAAALVMTVPMLMDRVNTLHVDLPLATLFLISLYYAYSSHKTRSAGEFVLFLAAAGMVMGIKLTGVIYGGVAIGFWVILEIQRWMTQAGGRKNSARSLRSVHSGRFNRFLIASGLLVFLLLSSFWYIRNAREAGFAIAENFPLQTGSLSVPMMSQQIIGQRLIEKLATYQSSTLTHQFNISNLNHWRILISQTVTRLQLPFVVMLLQLVFLPYAGWRVWKRGKLAPFLYAILLFLVSGFLYWNTPYSSGSDGSRMHDLGPLLGYNLRYGFPFLGLIPVMASVVATLVKTPQSIVVLAVWFSGLLGIISTALFDSIRTQAFMGQNQVWLSGLIQNILLTPNKVLTLTAESLGETWGNLLLYAGLYLLLTCLIYALTHTALQNSTKTSRGWVLRLRSRLPIRVQWFVGLAAIMLLVFTSTVQSIRYQNRALVYQGIDQFLAENVASGQAVGYFSSARNYLLYGERLTVPVLHRLPDEANPSEWLEQLYQDGAAFVAVGPIPSSQLSQGEFLRSLLEQGRLVPAFGQNPATELVIFRIVP